MTEQRLKRLLQSIGKEVFVEFYEAFADPRLPNDVIADRIVEYVKVRRQKKDVSYDAAITRVRIARKILESGNARVALLNCSQSKIPEEFRLKARRLAYA